MILFDLSSMYRIFNHIFRENSVFVSVQAFWAHQINLQ